MSNINCFVPGWDLIFAKPSCDSNICNKNYEPTCMYNSQGQYVCRKETKIRFNDGIDNILNNQNYVFYKSE